MLAAVAGIAPAFAQSPAKPAVGVVAAESRSITQASEYVGRIQAVDRVNLVARVAAFLDKRLFTEGAEVKAGDLLCRLEQGPFEADVQAKEAAVAQFQAQLQNAVVTLNRAKALLHTPAGQQSAVDAALANQESLKAQVLAAQAQLAQAKINLAYTEIRAPIDGKIGRINVTPGNYVSPNSGVLATIVSQDPMYVVFPVSSRTALDLQRRSADQGLSEVVIKLRLPDGRIYDQTGKVNFVDNTVSGNTDTITLRGAVANPLKNGARELVDGELVTVILEDAQPLQALTIPRAAVLSDQIGDYVYVVDAEDKAQQRRIELGQSTPSVAVVKRGLAAGDRVVVEGIQRVRPGIAVAPGPASVSATPPGASVPGSHPAGPPPSRS
jgi:membrane fusion protein (multidrug efflux system)